MKQPNKYNVYRDPITNQAVFINGITGQKTYGTDWSTEKNERELIKSERAKEERRKQN